MAVIVVADDDIDLADLVAYSFEVAGHTVHAARDGMRALALVQACRPDLVVLDHAMPGLNGLEVAAALRAEPDTARVPVIMISANGPPATHGLVDRLIAKPLRPRQLAAVIRELLPAGDVVGGDPRARRSPR